MEEQAKYNTIKKMKFKGISDNEWVAEKFNDRSYGIAAVFKPKITQDGTSTKEKEDRAIYGKFFIADRIRDEQIAMLMAAAPDLLEALQNVFVHAKVIINENHQDYKKAVKAINKALGIYGDQTEEAQP
ncbi:MAG: hypothetical protein M0Q12_10830 [Synergistaceae bacterium]|jgi:hypothetical protein|nr:hypothetical protein [Synergistaceae bacterium]